MVDFRVQLTNRIHVDFQSPLIFSLETWPRSLAMLREARPEFNDFIRKQQVLRCGHTGGTTREIRVWGVARQPLEVIEDILDIIAVRCTWLVTKTDLLKKGTFRVPIETIRPH